jgi:hypothetical protein
MSATIPPVPPNSFRITLTLQRSAKRLDGVLLKAMREQTSNKKLSTISRLDFKKLFSDGKISIKGQRAKPSSSLMGGITYVDIAGV